MHSVHCDTASSTDKTVSFVLANGISGNAQDTTIRNQHIDCVCWNQTVLTTLPDTHTHRRALTRPLLRCFPLGDFFKQVTIEPPKGIRSNLLGSFADLGAEFVHSSPKPEEWRRLMFACAFFHAVIQERSKFGPMGANVTQRAASFEMLWQWMPMDCFLVV